MSPVFADTSFYLALLNPRDRHHAPAAELARQRWESIVTSEFVLLEIGNALSGTPRGRDRFLALAERVRTQRGVALAPASHDMFLRGMGRYRDRRDKTWSLTDCISFVIMEEQRLSEVLTADRHFEQAGFKILLK
jgi:predicted nucleic acid-binding protein